MVLLKEDQLIIINQNGVAADCSRCEEKVSVPCFGCAEDCGVYLHKVCTKTPLKLNHPWHPDHPLILMKDVAFYDVPCKRCGRDVSETCFGCPEDCWFYLHKVCAEAPSELDHPFPFICDGCGTGGDHVAYTCGPCGIIVHRKCISLPGFIKSKWHDDRLSHVYALHRKDMGVSDCIICYEEVNADHGGYSCSKCNDIFHVNWVTEDEELYYIVEDEDEEPLDPSINSMIVLEWNDVGEAIVVQHFMHIHSLTLGDKVSKDNKKM
ncbi:hypothetical protein GQ457_13G028470 [Hibiscus cannabinus]